VPFDVRAARRDPAPLTERQFSESSSDLATWKGCAFAIVGKPREYFICVSIKLHFKYAKT
jgi:hypothetical protein